MNRFIRRTNHKSLAAAHSCCAIAAAGLLAATMAMACVGCGKSARVAVYPTEGRIMRAGRPLAGATVVFHPRGVSESPILARAQTDAGGRFHLTTYENGDGAPPGDYVVTVVQYAMQQQAGAWTPGPNTLPRKYASAKTSDLRVQVTQGENSLRPLVLGTDRRLSSNPQHTQKKGKDS